jgi:hypothetical protein
MSDDRDSSDVRRVSLVPQPRGPIRGARRWLTISRHEVRTAIRSWRWWVNSLLTVAQVAALALPVLAASGVKGGLLSFSAWFVITLVKKARDVSPKNMQLLTRNYIERKLRLYDLITVTQRHETTTPPEVMKFQRDALILIASYVRDHRADSGKTKIFANLLIEDGDNLIVVARDQDHRTGRASYPKEGMIVWDAMLRGEAVVTGDLCADFPHTLPGKRYKSVLAIPVFRSGVVVGAVSIDSSERYHFDLEAAQLTTYLMPYIALLSWTLLAPSTSLKLPKAQK